MPAFAATTTTGANIAPTAIDASLTTTAVDASLNTTAVDACLTTTTAVDAATAAVTAAATADIATPTSPVANSGSAPSALLSTTAVQPTGRITAGSPRHSLPQPMEAPDGPSLPHQKPWDSPRHHQSYSSNGAQSRARKLSTGQSKIPQLPICMRLDRSTLQAAANALLSCCKVGRTAVS
ncbi:hypothetical protein AOQ84DRAFT_354005, partial [Glonium stellatum]